jgi:hypothetical protein
MLTIRLKTVGFYIAFSLFSNKTYFLKHFWRHLNYEHREYFCPAFKLQIIWFPLEIRSFKSWVCR